MPHVPCTECREIRYKKEIRPCKTCQERDKDMQRNWLILEIGVLLLLVTILIVSVGNVITEY